VSEDPKNKFTTAISQEAIDAALASVEKAKTKAPVDEAAVEALKKEVDQLKQQLEFSQTKGRETLERLKEEHDRVLRAAADLDNQKKRAQREKEESTRFGLEKFLKEMLPVADNLDRAIGHADQSDKAALLQGVKMTSKLLEDTFAKYGVKPFSAAGLVFDPRVHEAMQQVEVDGPGNMVHEEFLRGYNLHDRLIRPALVAVSKSRAPAAVAPAPAAEAPSASPEGAAPAEPGAPNKGDAN
jgi:molecular chaperone GrpE